MLANGHDGLSQLRLAEPRVLGLNPEAEERQRRTHAAKQNE